MLKKELMKMLKPFTAISMISIIYFQYSMAQTDSLIFRNGNHIVGEVKTMDRSVVTVKTPYSDKDFAIKWHRIKEIYTDTYFLITLTDGSRYNGTIRATEPGRVSILTDSGESVNVNLIDIVFLNDLDKGFWSQISFSFDVGFDLTKANNFKQFTTNSKLGYTAKRWNLDLFYSTMFSRQNNTEDINRTDAGISHKFFMPKDWYTLASVDFLSNTEQRIELRTTGKMGMGKFITHTNKSYWGFAAGANFNNEVFFNDTTSAEPTPDKQSMEGFLGSELNLFNVGDLDLLTNLTAYPSFTESGRWRFDFKFEAKYEMWFDDDFYIKLAYSLNFDNQPVENASSTDYVFQTGFGWEW
jgi:hypothetical protein